MACLLSDVVAEHDRDQAISINASNHVSVGSRPAIGSRATIGHLRRRCGGSIKKSALSANLADQATFSAPDMIR